MSSVGGQGKPFKGCILLLLNPPEHKVFMFCFFFKLFYAQCISSQLQLSGVHSSVQLLQQSYQTWACIFVQNADHFRFYGQIRSTFMKLQHLI